MVDAQQRFREAYGEHVRAVAAFALRRVPAPADADDIVSETFLVAWRRFGEAPADLRPWLFGVARHVLRHHYRAGQRRDALSARLAEALAVLGSAADDCGWLGADALPRLSENDRDVLTLTAWRGSRMPRRATCSAARRPPLPCGCIGRVCGSRLCGREWPHPATELEGATHES